MLKDGHAGNMLTYGDHTVSALLLQSEAASIVQLQCKAMRLQWRRLYPTIFTGRPSYLQHTCQSNNLMFSAQEVWTDHRAIGSQHFNACCVPQCLQALICCLLQDLQGAGERDLAMLADVYLLPLMLSLPHNTAHCSHRIVRTSLLWSHFI